MARDTEFLLRKKDLWDFPGGPVAKTLCSQGWGPGLITGQGIQSHILQLKTLCAAAKTQGSQINIYIYFKVRRRLKFYETAKCLFIPRDVTYYHIF